MGKTVSRAELAKMYPEHPFGEQLRIPVRIGSRHGWAIDTIYPNSAYTWRSSLPSLVDELIRQSSVEPPLLLRRGGLVFVVPDLYIAAEREELSKRTER